MPIYQTKIHDIRVILKVGDITKEEVDVIVNAANPSLLGGGGVDFAIHQAAGPLILEECKRIRSEQKQNNQKEGCTVGDAVVTSGGQLKAKYVFHGVGPDMRNKPSNGDLLLAKVYEKCLALARDKKAQSIAFPSISTGIYNFPIHAAAKIVLNTFKKVLKHPTSLREVRVILFNDEDFAVYKEIFSHG